MNFLCHLVEATSVLVDGLYLEANPESARCDGARPLKAVHKSTGKAHSTGSAEGTIWLNSEALITERDDAEGFNFRNTESTFSCRKTLEQY